MTTIETVLDQHQETESKYIPITADAYVALERHRSKAVPINQIYLTHPDDPCSLRVRQEGSSDHTATLKIPLENNEARASIEVEPTISPATFTMYAALNLPRLQKDRATIAKGSTIDWFNHAATPLLEVERPARLEDVFNHDLAKQFLDVSLDPAYRNNQIAHDLYVRRHGRSPIEPYAQPDVDEQVAALIQKVNRLQESQDKSLVITVAGGSASGKTTRVAEVLAEETGGKLVSMDDYYMGQAIAKELYDYDLTDINFDHPEFYRTRLLGTHLAKLSLGETIALRQYQMKTAELAGEYAQITANPGRPIIIEGIYANHPEVAKAADVNSFVDAPMPIRVMRRIMRDHFSGEREVVFKTPGDHLRYLLEVCETSFTEHGAHQKESADIVINT